MKEFVYGKFTKIILPKPCACCGRDIQKGELTTKVYSSAWPRRPQYFCLSCEPMPKDVENELLQVS